MTDQDELSRLARAITMAEDDLNESNHRDDCQQLAALDEQRTALVERIEAREKALEDARAGLLEYTTRRRWEAASADAVKVEISPTTDTTIWHVAEPAYSNGLDGHQED